MQYIVTNFAYGTGPYLRTTELAIAVNDRLRELGKERCGIIVPLVYGEKQKRVMREEFGDHEKAFSGEILLDEALGKILRGVFYGDNTYEEALRLWTENYVALSDEAFRHLSGRITAETLDGKRREIAGSAIVCELSRAPRIRYGVAPAAHVTFGYISEILEHVLKEPKGQISVDRRIVADAILIAKEVEADAIFHGLAEPGTFSYLGDRLPRYPVEVLIPPTISPPQPNDEPITEGIYVTITGIPGLERLYREARSLGLRIYSNDPDAVPGAERLSPHAISNPRIKLQFARSGWGSIWLSMLSGTPFVAPAFDQLDDPEIYFNNICVEKLGLGIIYRGQPLREILDAAERMRSGIKEFNQRLLQRFGTLNGNEYAARLIVERFYGR